MFGITTRFSRRTACPAGLASAIREGRELVIPNETRGQAIGVTAVLTSRQREILLAGGLLNHVRKNSCGTGT